MKLQNESSDVTKNMAFQEGERVAEKKMMPQEEESAAEKKMMPQEEESAAEKKMIPQEEESTAEEKTEALDAKNGWVKKVKILVIVGFVLILLLLLKLFFNQRIDSVESLQLYMKRFGIAAPLMLTLFQALQVVVPVLPGYLGCAAGAVAFGTMTGFWCNYIGISLGSIIAYFLAKKYGKSIVLSLFPQKQYEKWSGVVKKSRSYGWFLFIATLLPLFPDDFLCYFSGLMKMNSKKFIWIIVLGKPWCILAYSIGFGLIR